LGVSSRQKKSVQKASSDDGQLSGGLFFLPGSSTVANTVYPKKIVIELLDLFEVEGPHEEIAKQ
jgi:hypothetical protein